MWAGGATGRGAEAQIPQRPGPLHGEAMGFLFPSCKFVWREVAKARMRPHRVVVLPLALDDDLRFGARAEPFESQAFVAKLAVEAFADAILPGLAGLD